MALTGEMMPKRTYKLLRFDGGINNDADPRDIGDNQFADLQNVAVDEMGKIVVLGDIQTTQNHGTALTFTGDLTGEGNSFFACTTDHTGLLDGGLDNIGTTYYLVENANTINGMGNTDGETGTIACDIGGEGATMYYVDGALRIADADHVAGGTVPVWRGFIEGKTYINDTTAVKAVITEGWVTANAEIAGCFPTSDNFEDIDICKNAIMLNIFYCDPDEADWSGGKIAYSFDKQNNSGTHDNTYNGITDEATSDDEWGFALEFYEDTNGTGTWMPQDDVKYKFWVTTMYDDHTQESLPQFLRTIDTDQIFDDKPFDGKSITKELSFRNGDTATAGENVKVSMKPVFKIVSDTVYNFGAAEVGHEGGVGEEGNKRISGARVYWSSNEDGHTTLWQIYDAKFDEGCKVIGADGGGGGTSGYAPWTESPDNTHGGGEHATIGDDAYNSFTDPPRYLQYDVLNQHFATDVIKVDSYKTAVVANNRVYIGNIKQDGKIHGDRMLKSPVKQYDKFPSINWRDIAVHDGDDIIALIEYADRILQFKKNTCYIINISGNDEFLEAEYKFKGITNPGAVCRTDYGAAWVNQNGCYMYDGQQVTDLLEDGGQRKINQAIWSTFIGTENYHRIGFNPFKRQLIILNGKGSTAVYNDAYVYDMVTKSWTYSTFMVELGDTNSNFINDPVDGSLLIFADGGINEIHQWADTPLGDATPSIVIKTKDIDFGEPAVRKKIYKVRMSYKGDGTNVIIKYGTNGQLTPAYQFNSNNTPLTNAGTTDWQHVDLTPTTSSEAKNAYSFQLSFSGNCETDFEINDISIIYRSKSVK